MLTGRAADPAVRVRERSLQPRAIPWPANAWTAFEWAVRVIAPLAALLLEGPLALLGTLVFQEAVFWLARYVAPEQTFGRRLFVFAYGVRAAVAVGLHAYLLLARGTTSLFQDDATYDLVAQWLVRINGGAGLSIFPGHQHLLDNVYVYLVAGIYAVVGHAPIVPKLLNAAVGGLVVVLVFRLGLTTFNRQTGRLAGIAAALMPTMVFWSAVMLKEMIVFGAILLALVAIEVLTRSSVRSRTTGTAVVLLIGSLAAVSNLRVGSALIILPLVPLVLVSRMARRMRPLHVALATLAVVLLAAGTLTVARVRAPDSLLARLTRPEEMVRSLSQRRAFEAVDARSQIESGQDDGQLADVVDVPGYREPAPFAVVDDVLAPLGFALLAPAPWQVQSLRDLAAGAEVAVWYVFLAGALFCWAAGPRNGLFALLLALYGLGTWFILAFAEGNLGNLLRHRMMIAPSMLVLGSAGLLYMWYRRPQAWLPARVRTPVARLLAADGPAR